MRLASETEIAHSVMHVHCAGEKAAAYIPGTDANRESKDRQYEEGYRSSPGTGTGNGYGSATSRYGTGTSQDTSGTAGMTTGDPDLQQSSRMSHALNEAHRLDAHCNLCFPASSNAEAQATFAMCLLDVRHQHAGHA